MSDVTIIRGDCRDVLPALADRSVDAVITDPPYPCVRREYGEWTEAEWHALMDAVVPECRRVLKPSGSAVFILQPNSERVGRMRLWLWEFLVRWGREWNQIQDVWWWNHATAPVVHCQERHGLMRPSLKACVWLGPPDAYRNQSAVLWQESDKNRAQRLSGRLTNNLEVFPSRYMARRTQLVGKAALRGGVTPFNVLPIANTNSTDSAGSHGHGAGTPQPLTDWWTRYICPPGGTVLDPFLGSGTTGLSALKYGCSFIGIERDADYCAVARARLDAARAALPLLA